MPLQSVGYPMFSEVHEMIAFIFSSSEIAVAVRPLASVEIPSWLESASAVGTDQIDGSAVAA